MATYWHLHPRGFSNECSIVRCEDKAEEESAEECGYERLTWKELTHHVRWINDENAAWGSGNANGFINLDDVRHGPGYRFQLAQPDSDGYYPEEKN